MRNPHIHMFKVYSHGAQAIVQLNTHVKKHLAQTSGNAYLNVWLLNVDWIMDKAGTRTILRSLFSVLNDTFHFCRTIFLSQSLTPGKKNGPNLT